ncbi:MAG TPA: MaoC family dehydratase [Pseudonocardiaceae bacterium]|nr:MaoC family dehydratase [Pseudonocardiaceae bacterium]
MSVFTTTVVPPLGAELPGLARRWTQAEFTERHEVTYGPGRIVPEAWPEHNLHSDPEAAAREGLSAPIASAPQLISMVHRQMLACFGMGWLAGGTIDVKMIKPVFVDDLTTAKGRVTGIALETDATGAEVRRVTCEVWVERLGGQKVLVGTASGLLRD